MKDVEDSISRRIKTRRVLSSIMVGFTLLGTILYFIKLPVYMAGWFVPFKIETKDCLI